MDIIVSMSKKEANIIINVLTYYANNIKIISHSLKLEIISASDDLLEEKIHSAQKIAGSLYDIINSTGRRREQTTHDPYYGDDNDYEPLPYEVCQSTEIEERIVPEELEF